jgi:hypothetical protein
MSYFPQPDEIAFWLGPTRAFVNPPLPEYFQEGVGTDGFVYRADQTIRINRDALINHYAIVLREVVRLSRMRRDEAHAALMQVRRSLPASSVGTVR